VLKFHVKPITAKVTDTVVTQCANNKLDTGNTGKHKLNLRPMIPIANIDLDIDVPQS